MDDDNWVLISERALTVYLEIPFASAWGRIGKLAGRPLISGRTASEVEALYERRRKRYEQAAHRVDGDRPAGGGGRDVVEPLVARFSPPRPAGYPARLGPTPNPGPP